MKATLRRRLERAMRVRDFLRAHQTDGVDQAAEARLEELLARAEVLAAQQRTGVIAERKATEQRTKLRRSLHTQLLRHLERVATVAMRENADLAKEFELPRAAAPNQALVTMARGMLEKATAQKALLVSRGMPEKVLDDVAGALGDFEKTLEAARAGRRDHVGAGADLEAVTVEITEQVRILDSLVRYRFGDNAELMGAWFSAYNVVGPFRSKAEPQTGGGETPVAVAPAA